MLIKSSLKLLSYCKNIRYKVSVPYEDGKVRFDFIKRNLSHLNRIKWRIRIERSEKCYVREKPSRSIEIEFNYLNFYD